MAARIHKNRNRIGNQGGQGKWRDYERQGLRLICTLWDLTDQQRCDLLHRLFPYFREIEERNYSQATIRYEWLDRRKTGRSQRWWYIDRPNKKNRNPYTVEEREEQMRLQALIEKVASDLLYGPAIPLTVRQGAVLQTVTPGVQSAVNALMQVRSHEAQLDAEETQQQGEDQQDEAEDEEVEWEGEGYDVELLLQTESWDEQVLRQQAHATQDEMSQEEADQLDQDLEDLESGEEPDDDDEVERANVVPHGTDPGNEYRDYENETTSPNEDAEMTEQADEEFQRESEPDHTELDESRKEVVHDNSMTTAPASSPRGSTDVAQTARRSFGQQRSTVPASSPRPYSVAMLSRTRQPLAPGVRRFQPTEPLHMTTRHAAGGGSSRARDRDMSFDAMLAAPGSRFAKRTKRTLQPVEAQDHGLQDGGSVQELEDLESGGESDKEGEEMERMDEDLDDMGPDAEIQGNDSEDMLAAFGGKPSLEQVGGDELVAKMGREKSDKRPTPAALDASTRESTPNGQDVSDIYNSTVDPQAIDATPQGMTVLDSSDDSGSESSDDDEEDEEIDPLCAAMAKCNFLRDQNGNFEGLFSQEERDERNARMAATLFNEQESLHMIHHRHLLFIGNDIFADHDLREPEDSKIFQYGGPIISLSSGKGPYEIMVCNRQACGRCRHQGNVRIGQSPTNRLPFLHRRDLGHFDHEYEAYVLKRDIKGRKLNNDYSSIVPQEKEVLKVVLSPNPLVPAKDNAFAKEFTMFDRPHAKLVPKEYIREVMVCKMQHCHVCSPKEVEVRKKVKVRGG